MRDAGGVEGKALLLRPGVVADGVYGQSVFGFGFWFFLGGGMSPQDGDESFGV